MKTRFRDAALEELEMQLGDQGYPQEVVTMYRKRMQLIYAAASERDFYALKSLHYEKLKGDRRRQRSMRLNDQWRLILEIEEEESGRVVVVVGIEDYH